MASRGTRRLVSGAPDVTHRHYVIDAIQKEYAQVRPPNLGLLGEPHAVVSRLPCKSFVTTCFDGFLEDALTAQGKHPTTVGAVLGEVRRPDTADPSPTISEPLVFHAFGLINEGRNLVVTTSDHFSLVQRGLQSWPNYALWRIYNSGLLWIGFDSEKLEYRTMSALVGNSDLYRKRSFFYLQFEPEQKNEPSVLLRDFMVELSSRWEQRRRQ